MGVGKRAEAHIRHAHAAGDLAHAATLAMHAYGAELYRFLLATVRNEADAADLNAELWEEIWRTLPRFEHRSSFRTWAYLIARHACARFFRSPRRRRQERLQTSQISRLAEQLRTTQWGAREQAADRLDELRAALSAEERQLLYLRIDRKLAWSEIAQVMEGEATEAALRQQFSRLTKRLRDMAREAGLLPEG